MLNPKGEFDGANKEVFADTLRANGLHIASMASKYRDVHGGDTFESRRWIEVGAELERRDVANFKRMMTHSTLSDIIEESNTLDTELVLDGHIPPTAQGNSLAFMIQVAVLSNVEAGGREAFDAYMNRMQLLRECLALPSRSFHAVTPKMKLDFKILSDSFKLPRPAALDEILGPDDTTPTTYGYYLSMLRTHRTISDVKYLASRAWIISSLISASFTAGTLMSIPTLTAVISALYCGYLTVDVGMKYDGFRRIVAEPTMRVMRPILDRLWIPSMLQQVIGLFNQLPRQTRSAYFSWQFVHAVAAVIAKGIQQFLNPLSVFTTILSYIIYYTVKYLAKRLAASIVGVATKLVAWFINFLSNTIGISKEASLSVSFMLGMLVNAMFTYFDERETFDMLQLTEKSETYTSFARNFWQFTTNYTEIQNGIFNTFDAKYIYKVILTSMKSKDEETALNIDLSADYLTIIRDIFLSVGIQVLPLLRSIGTDLSEVQNVPMTID